jgi:cell division inhibitor SepF
MGAMNSILTFFGFGSSEAAKPETAASNKPKSVAPRPRRSGEMSEIMTLDPQSYADAKEVAASFRMNIPVIVNIAAMSEPDAKRMLDFMIGLKEGLDGHLRRVTPKVYLLSPSHVAVTDSDASEADVSQEML